MGFQGWEELVVVILHLYLNKKKEMMIWQGEAAKVQMKQEWAMN